MPHCRKPVSAPTRSFMPRQASSDLRMSGISRGSRPICRHQPQFRPDCSQAISPFSNSVTSMPRSASSKAVETPTMPPPITATAVRRGRVVSLTMGSTIGAMGRWSSKRIAPLCERAVSQAAQQSGDWLRISGPPQVPLLL
jgi:hypothetical protein